jgi:hypothetical protein
MLEIDDMDNGLLARFPDTIRQKYVDYANEEILDLAKRFGVDPTTIQDPIHFKIKRHAINVALNMFAQDYIGVNNNQGVQGEDVYEELFKRTNYILQKSKLGLTKVMFTGEQETPENRAVQSVRIVRG